MTYSEPTHLRENTHRLLNTEALNGVGGLPAGHAEVLVGELVVEVGVGVDVPQGSVPAKQRIFVSVNKILFKPYE